MSSGSDRAAAFGRVSRAVRGWQADQDGFDAVVAELAGLNRTDWRCLDIIGTRGPLTAGQLADGLRLTTGAVTVVIDRLERAGLVRRVRDEADRRRVIIEPTPEVARRAAPVYTPFVADAMAALATFDAAQVDTILAFIATQRELLARHTLRVRDLLEAEVQVDDPG